MQSPRSTDVQGQCSYSSPEVQGQCLRCMDEACRPERRVTRRYEAARRNGHYTPTPLPSPLADNVESRGITVSKATVTLHKVRRKLQFGRKPPKVRIRGDDSTVAAGDCQTPDLKLHGRLDSSRSTRLDCAEGHCGSAAAGWDGYSNITQELRHLEEAATCPVYKTRLRSCSRKHEDRYGIIN